MVRFLHVSDLHLGSKLDTHFDAAHLPIRKDEVNQSFERIIRLANENGCRAILIAGDLFDTGRVAKRVFTYVRSQIQNHPELDFLILHGNHDFQVELSNDDGTPIENLKLFSNQQWTSYDYEDVTISGTENLESVGTDTLPCDKKVHIVMLHGEAKVTSVLEGETIPLLQFRNKGIGYMALGHYHSYSATPLDARGVYVYSGCPEGRGLDECGEKGAVLLSIENGEVSYEFKPMSLRQLHDYEVDVSGLVDYLDIQAKIRDTIADAETNDIVRLKLVGTVTEQTDLAVDSFLAELQNRFWYAWIENQTKLQFNPKNYETEISLKGEFIRLLAQDESLSDEEREEILLYGLRALNGEEVIEKTTT